MISASTCKCQLIETTYLNYYFKESVDKTSNYIKEIYKTDSGYKIITSTNPKCKFWDNKPKELISEINYKSLKPEVEEGIFKNKEFLGQYKDGEMVGLWYLLDSIGKVKDTLDYSFNVINHQLTNNKIKRNTNKTVSSSDSIQIILNNKIIITPRTYEKGEDGEIEAEILTNSNGEVTKIIITKSISKDMDKEVIRVILKYFPLMKNWKGLVYFSYALL
jgi:hypothetical protein